MGIANRIRRISAGIADSAGLRRNLVGTWLVASVLFGPFGSTVLAQQSAPARNRSGVCDVRAFGAVGDGKKLDTDAINAAIRSCAEGGGGIVEFSAGTYLSGTIQMLSNINVHLEAGATILGSPNVRDYRSISRSSEGRATALIVAEHAEKIAITGLGTIDGNGRSFIREPRQPHPPGPFQDFFATRQGAQVWERVGENREGPVRMRERPGVLVLFVECRDVTIRDITVLDAPNWCIHLACCDGVLLTSLDVRCSLLVPNADALDVSGSRDVRISDSYLQGGDDGIAVSPCADGYCQMAAENIAVSNCELVSRSAAIRLGWAAHDIRNLTFTNLVIHDSNRGIGIFVRGTENIENVLFSNIVIETRLMDGLWWGLGEPIHISVAHYDAKADINAQLKAPLGQVRNVRFVNVTTSSEAPIVLYSQEPGRIRGVLLSDCRQTVKESPLNTGMGGNLDLRPTNPGRLGLTKYDMAAFIAHGVENLQLRGFDLDWQGTIPEFYTGGLEADAFKNICIDNFTGRGPRVETPAIVLRDGENATVRDSRATTGKLLVLERVRGRQESGSAP